MGAGLITLDGPLGIHGIFALIAFLFLNLEAIFIGLKLEGSLRAFSVVAGIIGFIFLLLMIMIDSGSVDVSGSIGHGGAERLIAYPALLWMMIFGGYLLAKPVMSEAK
jgi:hypothetical protein